jgi:Helix-turn-helix domain
VETVADVNTNHFSPQSKTQAAAILRLLIDARGSWVPLPEILRLGIAQYSARIFELRRQGFEIQNKTERVGDSRHSWFRLVTGSTAKPELPKAETPKTKWEDRPRVTGLELWDAAVRK